MQRITVLILLLLAPLCGIECSTSTDNVAAVVAFVNVNVVPMDSERLLANQTVVVRDGRIEEVGDATTVGVPAGASLVDGRGKYLMPGLADMHVHVQSEGELLLAVAHGVTTMRDMFGSPYKVVWRERIARGDLLGPTLYAAGPIVDGARPDMGQMTSVRTAEDAERAVSEQKERGYDFIKVYHNLSREAYAAVVAAARRHSLPVAGHVTNAVGLLGALDAGQQCIEHLDGYTYAMQRIDSPYAPGAGRKPQSGNDYLKSIDFIEEGRIPALAAATRAKGVWNCPTLIAYETWGLTVEEARARASRPEMRFVHPLLMEQWSPRNQPEVPYSDSIQSDADAALMKRRVAVHMKLTKALQDAGAGLLLGTDAGVPYAIPGVSAIEELELMVSAGLTPYQALRAGTRNAAEYMNALGQFGTVTVGTRADLILLEGNPLQDVANLRQLAGVMLRGRWMPQPELRSRLDELVTSYRAPKQWFSSMPDMAVTAHYVISSFGLTKGEERVAIETRTDGRQVITSQLSAQEPLERYQVRMEGSDRLTINSDGREGRGDIELRLDGQRVFVKGSLPVIGEVRLDEAVGPDILLKPPGIAFGLILYPVLKSLAVNQSREISVREWDYGPDFALSRREWKVQRLPNAPGSMRVFAIEVVGDAPQYGSRLTVDERGVPEMLEIQQGDGLVKYQRVRP